MTNESDLPQFSGGPLTPIGKVMNPGGLPVAHKKQASGLLKRIMANAKPMTKARPKAKPSRTPPSRRGIESDNKVHVKPLTKYW